MYIQEEEFNGLQIYNVRSNRKEPFTFSMDWYVHLPFESAHNSEDAKTPVAVMVSLQMTPLYGLCGKPKIIRKYVF